MFRIITPFVVLMFSGHLSGDNPNCPKLQGFYANCEHNLGTSILNRSDVKIVQKVSNQSMEYSIAMKIDGENVELKQLADGSVIEESFADKDFGEIAIGSSLTCKSESLIHQLDTSLGSFPFGSEKYVYKKLGNTLITEYFIDDELMGSYTCQ